MSQVEKFKPEINKVYFINQQALFHILEGGGLVEVDFKNYLDWEGKGLFLDKGQYIKFLSDDFVVRRINFPNADTFNSQEMRVLFKHLISLGYISFEACEACRIYLNETAFSGNIGQILDISSKQWYWENPFNANKEEYQLIFNIKDVVDRHYNQNLTTTQLIELIDEDAYFIKSLVKSKIGITIKDLYERKRLAETKKEIAFTDKNIQEIAWNMGYKDPSYFNRAFKAKTGKSPATFRVDFDFKQRDRFVQNLIDLIKTHHTSQHKLGFYADKMHLSVKALSKKVKSKMQRSLGQLIRFELIETAKKKLRAGENIKEVAFELGFEEANHFSGFFKKNTGVSPSGFLAASSK